MHTVKASLVALIATLGLVTSAGCPGGAPGVPGVPGGAASSVDPNTCGNYAASEAGAKLKAFLEATVQLETAVKDTENYVKDTCIMMGKELGLAALEGDTKTVCDAVVAGINDNMKIGLQANASLTLDYEPARCEVSVDAAASFAAKCEAKAEADIDVKCTGTCTGTCSGQCSGTCSGQCSGTCNGTCNGTCSATNADGSCAGECDGTCEGSCSASCEGSCDASCEGSCSGGCDGHAEVQAEASCQAKAEVSASVEAECTEPKVDISWDAEVVVDESALTKVKAALEVGMPRLLKVAAKIGGPVKAAFQTWSKAAGDLVKASGKLYNSLGDQATCVVGQLKAAAGMIAGIEASISVQVEVSASVEGSASGGGGGSASGGGGAATHPERALK